MDFQNRFSLMIRIYNYSLVRPRLHSTKYRLLYYCGAYFVQLFILSEIQVWESNFQSNVGFFDAVDATFNPSTALHLDASSSHGDRLIDGLHARARSGLWRIRRPMGE